MKKVLSLLLVIVMLCSTFAGLQVISHAEMSSSGSCGTNVTYTFNSSTGLLTIKGSGAMSNYSNYSSSSKSPFYSQTDIKTVVIQSGVTSIGSYAFYWCSGLTSVTIPNSVTSIGSYAFYWCSGLTSVTIPNSVTSIGISAFEQCSWLPSVTIPDSVTSIGDSAFRGCSGLTSVNIGNSVTSIGGYAFRGCSSLTSVTIPDSVTSIGDSAFSGCSSLTHIAVASGNKKYDSRNNCNAIIESSTNKLIIGCKNTVIPDSVTSIGSFAFYNCSSLTSITIPDSVTSIGNSAFRGCSGLKELAIPCSAKIYNSEDTFKNSTNIEKVTLTKGTGTMQDYGTSVSKDAAETYYQYTPWFISRAKLKEIVLEEGVEHIGNYAFYAQSNILCILIPASVTNIGEHAFGLCNALKDVYYPASEAQWNQMTVATDNDALLGATIHFNHTHQFENPVVTATCTQSGKKTAYCACGKIQDEMIPALGHAFGEWILIKAPTCTAEGRETRVCARDASHTETRAIEARGHKFAVGEQYCQNGCGIENPDYVPPHVHAYTSAFTTAPTCIKAGVKTFTCACGDSYTEPIPALGHEFKAVKTASTATAVGYTRYKCTCGEYKKDAKGGVIKDSYTAPTGKQTLKCKARTANAQTVIWNNVKTATGYQVQISTKDGKKWSTYATLKAGVTAYTFKNLVAGNNYKFRVRFYINAPDGKNYFSPWSATLNSPTLPSGTAIKLTAAKKAFTAKWTKVAGVTGYQIQYATNAKFTGAKAVTLKGASKYAQAVKNLKGGARYYVRIRTYKTVGGKNYFSAWSAAKAVTTKK